MSYVLERGRSSARLAGRDAWLPNGRTVRRRAIHPEAIARPDSLHLGLPCDPEIGKASAYSLDGEQPPAATLNLARLLSLALTLGIAGAAHAEDTVTCKDGTTSKGGSGACSGHGGVEKKAKGAPAAAPAAPQGSSKGKPSNTDPTGAIARCKGKEGVGAAGAPGYNPAWRHSCPVFR